MIVLGTLDVPVTTGAEEEEAAVEEGRSVEELSAEEEADAAVPFHMLEVDEDSTEAEELVTEADALETAAMLEVALTLLLTGVD